MPLTIENILTLAVGIILMVIVFTAFGDFLFKAPSASRALVALGLIVGATMIIRGTVVPRLVKRLKQ